VLIFSDSHQDTGSAVLNVLQLLDVLARNPGLKEMKAWTCFSASGKVKVGRSLEMLQRWWNEVLYRCLI